jgi:hypothetical protein
MYPIISNPYPIEHGILISIQQNFIEKEMNGKILLELFQKIPPLKEDI